MLSLYPTKNRSLARIATLKDDKWKEITSKQLPKTLRTQLNAFFVDIAGFDLPDDLTTLLCAFDRQTQAYVRTYAPCVYCSMDNNAIVVWGNEEFVLTAELLNKLDAEVQLVELEKYKETCLVFNKKIKLEGDKKGTFVEFPLQLRIKSDHREMPLAQIKGIVKEVRAGEADIGELADLLFVREPKEKKEFKPTYSLKELPEDVDIKVLGAEEKDFGTHVNFILAIEYDGNYEQCYAPTIIKNSLLAGAELTADTKFKYVKRQGAKRTDYIVTVDGLFWAEEEDGLQL